MGISTTEFIGLLNAISLLPQIIENIIQRDLIPFKNNKLIIGETVTFLFYLFYQDVDARTPECNLNPLFKFLCLFVYANFATILICQEKFGPRFMVPKSLLHYLPNKYSYL